MNETGQLKLRIFAGALSLVVGLTLMLAKFYAYRVTGSTAILSDALESVVNVVAAGFSLFAIHLSHAPPDRNHPYGHGKIEFVTAVFEGGLITFAALLIAYEAVRAYLHGIELHSLSIGLWVVFGSGICNGLLGIYILRVGKKTQSLALVADGKHVIADFITSIGLLVGLFIVHFTQIFWLDAVVALFMAMVLAATGIPLVRHAIGGLLDAEDPRLLGKLLAALEKNRFPGLIRIHHVRAMRNGRRIHVDGHAVLPEFWNIEHAHDLTEAFEAIIVKDIFLEGEIEFHVDPCRRVYCKSCDVQSCPIRQQPFVNRPPITIDEMVNPNDITDRQRIADAL